MSASRNRLHWVLLAGCLGAIALLAFAPSTRATHPRPKAATPMYVPMVLAYNPCTSPNQVHAPPTPAGSCTPPTSASAAGTIDEPTEAVDSLYLTVGDPLTPTPEGPVPAAGSANMKLTAVTTPFTDLKIEVHVVDVRCKGVSGGCAAFYEDYTGELDARWAVKITEHTSSGTVTSVETNMDVTVPCVATAETTPGLPNDIGGQCDAMTSANAVVPGQYVAGQREIDELGQTWIFDGGSDGVAATTGDNTKYYEQGVFVP
jgi:hypothetical protein